MKAKILNSFFFKDVHDEKSMTSTVLQNSKNHEINLAPSASTYCDILPTALGSCPVTEINADQLEQQSENMSPHSPSMSMQSGSSSEEIKSSDYKLKDCFVLLPKISCENTPIYSSSNSVTSQNRAFKRYCILFLICVI